jgi:hypothetical protein
VTGKPATYDILRSLINGQLARIEEANLPLSARRVIKRVRHDGADFQQAAIDEWIEPGNVELSARGRPAKAKQACERILSLLDRAERDLPPSQVEALDAHIEGWPSR